MELFSVFYFKLCSKTEYYIKKNTDFAENSVSNVILHSKIPKFRI